MRQDGFTLVELMVALLIFGMLSAAGVALLAFSVDSQAASKTGLDRSAGLRRAGALLAADLAQAAPRIVRDESGLVRPAFESGGDGFAFRLVRGGWENPDGAPRPSLQKVEYALADGSLQRRSYRFVDGTEPAAATTLIEGVRALTVRYRDARGEWRETWDPVQPTDLPRAVELVVDTDREGAIRQLFVVGAPA